MDSTNKVEQFASQVVDFSSQYGKNFYIVFNFKFNDDIP